MEIKFKEVGNEYSDVSIESNKELKGLKVKTYLSLGEIKTIVDKALEEQDMIVRKMTIISMVTDYCTNLNIEDKNKEILCEEVYDLVMKYKLTLIYSRYIINYSDIEKFIKDSESTYKLAEMFIDQITEAIKGFDINKIQEGFNGLKEVINKNE